MKKIPCPICSSTSYAFFEYADVFDNPVSIYKCINCGHGSHDRLYTSEQLKQIYLDDYASDYVSEGSKLYQQRKIQYGLDVRLLLKISRLETVRVLDYGCSSGGYLDAMPEHWHKTGYEVNPYHVRYLQENKPYIQVFNSLESVDGEFDLITLRGVIEHIADHTQLLAFLNKHLTSVGSVFVTATPDFASICSTLYKKRWNQICCPEHIHQFSSASLCLLLAKAGLVLRSLHHPYLETPYADWENDKASFLNNFNKAQEGDYSGLVPNHAFAGTMMSALFQR